MESSCLSWSFYCQKHFLKVWDPHTSLRFPSLFLSTEHQILYLTRQLLHSHYVNVRDTSLTSVRAPTRIIIWSDVLDGAHVATDNALKCVLTWSAPPKIWDHWQQEQEKVAEEEKAAAQNTLNYTFE